MVSGDTDSHLHQTAVARKVIGSRNISGRWCILACPKICSIVRVTFIHLSSGMLECVRLWYGMQTEVTLLCPQLV